jgi:hypothetical protein
MLLKQFGTRRLIVLPFERYVRRYSDPHVSIPESEAVSLTGVFQCGCAIDENHSSIDVVFLAEFREK